MQRRARSNANRAARTALAVTLLGTLGATAACTSSTSGDEEEDASGGASASASAAPGKYRTLPEPCGAPSLGALKKMLPGAASESPDDPEAAASPYEGEARVTYDTDRRVGCRWKSEDSLGSHRLSVDFERVVSYDPAVSDDEQASTLYERRANAANIPPPEDESDGSEESETPDETPDPSSSAQDDGADKNADDGKGSKSDGDDSDKSDDNGDSGDSGDDSNNKDSKSPSDDATSPSGEGSGEGSPDEETSEDPDEQIDLAPRRLDDLGDTAYINDVLETAGSGVHRDITLVFRTANVIATVKYTRALSEDGPAPESRELQDRAVSLADQLTDALTED